MTTPSTGPDPVALRLSALNALLRFAAERYPDDYEVAIVRCRGGHDDEFDDEAAAADEELKLAYHFLFDHRLEDGRSPAEAYLREGEDPVDPREESVLLRLAASQLRPYEVEEVRLDRGISLRDLWTDEGLLVTDAATSRVAAGDVLVARVTPDVDGNERLEGGVYVFESSMKETLLDELRGEEREFRVRYPKLTEEDFFKTVAPGVVHGFWLDEVAFAS